jgi:hypothetical protein
VCPHFLFLSNQFNLAPLIVCPTSAFSILTKRAPLVPFIQARPRVNFFSQSQFHFYIAFALLNLLQITWKGSWLRFNARGLEMEPSNLSHLPLKILPSGRLLVLHNFTTGICSQHSKHAFLAILCKVSASMAYVISKLPLDSNSFKRLSETCLLHVWKKKLNACPKINPPQTRFPVPKIKLKHMNLPNGRNGLKEVDFGVCSRGYREK